MFYFIERNSGIENWNAIKYKTGPVEIKILGYEENIEIIIEDGNKNLLEEIILVTSQAWKFEEKDIVYKSEKKIIIKTNFEIIKNFLDYTIFFI